MTTAQATAESYAARLERTLPELRDRVRAAAESVGRDPASVRIVGVTKGHPVEAVDAALSAGLADLGENRVGELEEKRAARPDAAASWHVIGHIQSRKARRAADIGDLIHSVDSGRLAEKLARVGVEEGRRLDVLVQVNTSGEASKGGFALDGVLDAVHQVAELPGLTVRGLMTMAPLVDDERVLGAAFAKLRRTAESLRAVTDQVGGELSMGMTNDMEVAIREGSTMVRVGTALFGERPQ